MTTVSDAFDVPSGACEPRAAQKEGAGARARVRARLAGTVRDGKAGAAVAGVTRTVASDVRHAWLWDGTPPTLAQLWRDRIPDLDVVPAGNRGLRAAWAVYNHTALIITAPLYMALWVCQHPVRVLLAVLLTAPLLLVLI